MPLGSAKAGLLPAKAIFAASSFLAEGAGYFGGQVQLHALLRILKAWAWKHCPDSFHSRLLGLIG